MKRLLALLILIITLLMCLISCNVSEHIKSKQYEENGFRYSLRYDSFSIYAVIEYYNGTSNVVEIPSTFKGKKNLKITAILRMQIISIPFCDRNSFIILLLVTHCK